jgi:hypothetical protein
MLTIINFTQVNVSELGLVTPAGKVVWGKHLFKKSWAIFCSSLSLETCAMTCFLFMQANTPRLQITRRMMAVSMLSYLCEAVTQFWLIWRGTLFVSGPRRTVWFYWRCSSCLSLEHNTLRCNIRVQQSSPLAVTGCKILAIEQANPWMRVSLLLSFPCS